MHALLVAIMLVALCGGFAWSKPIISQKQREAIHIYNQGVDAVTRGDHQKGAELFKKAIELDPTQPDFYYNLGSAYSRLEKYELAEASLTKAIQLRPNDFDYLEEYGVIQASQHKYSKAEQAYTKAARCIKNAEQRRLYKSNWDDLKAEERKNAQKSSIPPEIGRAGNASRPK